MTNRTTKFASAILIGALAGTLLAVEATPLQAADNCLAGPKGAAPKGSHWYYRIDHATKRNCWYVRAEGGATTSANSSSTLALTPTKTPLQPSVANARAEATAADMRESYAGVGAPLPPAPASPQDSNQQAPDEEQALVPSPWPDQTNPEAAKSSTPRPADSSATPNSSMPSAAAAPLAAPAMRPASPSVLTLFFVIVGALATAALFGSIIFKYSSAARDKRNPRRNQRAPWDSFDVGSSMQSPPMATKAPAPQAGFAREHHEPVIPDEIVRLLAKLSREAAA